MAWTMVDDENGIINIRAILSTVHQQDQIRDLIAALEKRLSKPAPKEITDDRHDA